MAFSKLASLLLMLDAVAAALTFAFECVVSTGALKVVSASASTALGSAVSREVARDGAREVESEELGIVSLSRTEFTTESPAIGRCASVPAPDTCLA